MPISWIPKVKTVQEQIIEEEQRLWMLKQPAITEPGEEIPITEQPRFATTVQPGGWRPSVAELPGPEPIEPGFTPRWRPQVRAEAAVEPQIAPTITQPKKEYEWWEKPAEWTETAMGAVGKGISKVPVLPKILGWLAPAFEWIHEKLEIPFASIITAPWSPDLPWKAGESWLDHQKREYETWKAPTYIKGVAEFAMPLWWLPWLGWAAKGARALGVGSKMARASANILARSGKIGKVVLPTGQVLDDTLFRVDFFKTVAMWAEGKPVLHQIVKAVGGPSAFVSGVAKDPVGIVKRALIKRAVVNDMRHGASSIWMNRIQKFGDPVKLLNLTDDGLMRSAKTTVKGASRYVDDVIEDIIQGGTKYTVVGKEAQQYVKAVKSVVDDIYELAAKEGLKIPKEKILHRIVSGKTIPETGIFERSEFGALFEVQRHHKLMSEGIEAGVKYAINPNENIQSMINHYIKGVATKRFTDEVGALGKTALERFALQNPDIAEKILFNTTRGLAAKHALQSVNRMFSYRGAAIPPATMAKIRRGLPEIAERIEKALIIAPKQIDDIISGISRETWRALKINPKEFKVALAQFNKEPGRILLGEIDDTIRTLNVSNKIASETIEKIYKTAYRLNKQSYDDVLRTVQKEAQGIIQSARGELSPLMATRKAFVAQYAGGRQIFGDLAKFRRHPVFRDKIFPAEVVHRVEAVLGDQGSKWLAGMEKVSATSRMTVAALDFSAPFIQGLPLLGLNPVAWVKAVGKQFEFFLRPQKLAQFLDDPVQQAIRAERIAMGGSAGTFEYFEVLGAIQRTAGKIPVAGKGLKAVIRQTYGRAEAAFTGFGEVARNYLWQALRKPGMTDDALRDLARSIDRMTGVMSMEALGIGLTQKQFEGAWMFFSPRYTRAGLAYAGDMLKSGITGANARKSLGALMGGGLATYYGVCSVLGQQPNLDPRSAKFMTIKIGDNHLGVGGIYYALMRLAAGVATTATEEPLDLVRLSRFDNPFIKFMYSRSAPLTGLVTGLAIEHKNFFGEPFESAADYGAFLAEKVIPIAAQRIMPWEEHKVGPAVFGAEVMGMRTFPKSPWTQREEARERYALRRYGRSYKVLTELEQNEIDRQPDIKAFSEEADIRTEQMGGLSALFLKRKRERDDARFMYVNDLEQAQRAVDAGLMTGYEFREYLQTAGAGLGRVYEHIDKQAEYSEVLAKLEEPTDVSDKYIGDLAYDELMAASYSGVFEDEYGIFQYDKYNEFLERFRIKYGDEVYQYVLARKDQRRQDLPPLVQEYYKAQEVMRPYWEVQDWAVKTFGQAWADSSRGQAFISRMRKQMRLMNPKIAKYYSMFYQRT